LIIISFIMSNTSTQQDFTTAAAYGTASTNHHHHHPMNASNNDDGFYSFRRPAATQGHAGHFSSSSSAAAATRDMATITAENNINNTTTQYHHHREAAPAYQNVSSSSLPPHGFAPASSTTTTGAIAVRPPPVPTGQTRLRFVDCLAWMVNSLTAGHEANRNHDQEMDDDKMPMVWWSPDGQALYFRLDKDYEEQLSAVIKPYFKHGNFGSIRRQLFAYGFSKPLQGPYVSYFTILYTNEAFSLFLFSFLSTPYYTAHTHTTPLLHAILVLHFINRNKKGFTHPHFKRGELTPENLKLIVRKIKGGKMPAAKHLLQQQQDEESGDEDDDDEQQSGTFKPTMKQQAQQLVKDLNSSSAITFSDQGILSDCNPSTKEGKTQAKKKQKVTHRVSLDQDNMTAEDMAAVAKLKSLRAVPHQSIIDGNYQEVNNDKENSSPRLPPLPDYRREEKGPRLQPAPYVFIPSESGNPGSVVKVTRDWYLHTLQNKNSATASNVLVI
jgi:HSF-type DNA-binding